MSSDLIATLATLVGSVLAILLQRLYAKLQTNTDATKATQQTVNSVVATTEATETKVDVLSRALAQMIDKDQVFTTVMLDRDWHKRIFEEARRNPNCGECLQQVIEAMDRRKTERRMGDPMRRETDQ